MSKVGQHIKNLREALRWTQTRLATELSAVKPKTEPVARASVSRWEAGVDHPREENIKALAKVFNRPPTEFERFGAKGDTGYPSDPTRHFIPLLSWQDLKHLTAEGSMPRHALKKVHHQLEVDMATPTHAIGLTIQDDSMADRFMPGDEVIIDPKTVPVHDTKKPDFVLVRLASGQTVFRQYVLRAPGVYDLVALNPACKTESVTLGDPAELLGTMIEHRQKRRR